MYNVVQDRNEDAIQRTGSPYNWEAYDEYMDLVYNQNYDNLEDLDRNKPKDVGTEPCDKCGTEIKLHAPSTMIPNFGRCKDCRQNDLTRIMKEQGLTTLWGVEWQR